LLDSLLQEINVFAAMAGDAIILLALLFVSLLGSSNGYGSGAPTSECGSLAPGHGHSAKDNSITPFSIKLNSTRISPGGSTLIELTNVGSTTDTFKGYMVQARKVSDDSVIGTFETVSNDAKYLKCGNVAQSAVTHALSEAKKSIKMKWNAPSDFSGKVIILATFVRDYSTYWVKVPSETVEVSETTSTSIVFHTEAPISVPESEPGSGSEPESEPKSEPKSEPVSDAETESGSESGDDNHRHSQSKIYKGCDKSKSCFGVPNNCLKDESCNLVASWKLSGDYFELEMFRKEGAGNYVAMGFSKDSNMGDELVLACPYKSKAAELYWNSGKISPTYLSNNFGIQDFKFSGKDGQIYCSMKSPSIIKSNGYSVNLKDDQQTILLAGGPYSTNSLNLHTMKLAKESSVFLSQVTIAGAKSYLLFKLHGLFMLMAWIGCAGAGMIMARYFKQTWKGKQIFGADRWFQAHRLFMVCAVVLTVAAMVVIVIEVRVDPLNIQHLSMNAHPVIGLICVILAIIQPIMAAFRPHPGDSGRKIFNWAHWGVGNMAYVFGICAIFLAGTMSNAKLSSIEWWSWILLGYVVLHVLTHLIFSVLWAKTESSQRIGADHSMSEIHRSTRVQGNKYPVDEKQDQEGGSFRKILFFLYFLTAWVVVVVLAVAVFKAE